MSELKAFESERIYWAVEQVEREAGDIDNLHLDDNLFYLKSEADKVIAEKDKELRRHKYRRCLAMAKYCDASMAYFGEFHDSASEQMVAHYYKWRGRWYELAEKFNEVERRFKEAK